MKTRMTAAVILVLGMVAWSGCGADPTPEFEDRPSPAVATQSEQPPPSARESPEKAEKQAEVEPRYPAEARHAGRAGATAFVAFYMAAVSYGTNTGDLALLRSLAFESCTTCTSAADAVQGIYANGGRYEGAVLGVEVTEAAKVDNKPETWLVDFDLRGNRHTQIKPSGRQIPVHPIKRTGEFIVQRTRAGHSRWLIMDLDIFR